MRHQLLRAREAHAAGAHFSVQIVLVAVFLEAARLYYPEYFVLFLCAIHTGMRSGELAGLQWPDIDFNAMFLVVRRNFTRGRIEKTKTDQIRRVDLSDTLLHELDALKRHRQEEYLARGKNELPEWVFLSPGRIIWEDGRTISRREGPPVETYDSAMPILAMKSALYPQ